MKKRNIILLLFTLLAGFVRAQIMTTEGTDFWFTYLPNAEFQTQTSTVTHSVLISGNTYTTGTIEKADHSWSTTFSVAPGTVATVVIPESEITLQKETVDYCSFHVTSADPISLYASNYRDYSYDVTNVLPTQTNGNRYVLQSYKSESNTSDFRIVALTDSTNVFINMPEASTGNIEPNVTKVITLHQGQTYLVSSEEDISGTEVRTDCNHAIAVFVGAEVANIPLGAWTADHIFEQAVPTVFWGKKFALISSVSREHDIYKITALQNNTYVYVGQEIYELNARESVEFDVRSDSVESVFVISTKPICVYAYETGYSYGGFYGDPSSAIVHPLEQGISSISFATYNRNANAHHYVNIVTKSDNVTHVFLDGTQINALDFHEIPNSGGYVTARKQILHGSHHLYSDHGQFCANVYGLAHAESYAYSAGSSLDFINQRIYINGYALEQIDSNTRFCLLDNIDFYATCFAPDNTSITWDFGNGRGGTGPHVNYTFTEPGIYMVTVSFEYQDECSDLHTRVDTIPIHIYDQPSHWIDTVVCSGECEWQGETYHELGTYSKLFHVSDDVCDSIVYLNVLKIGDLPSPSLDFEYDCISNLLTLSASGVSDSYYWISNPYNAQLQGHESDSIIVVSNDFDCQYSLVSYYYPDSSCIDTVSMDIIKVQPDVLQAKFSASPSVVTLDNNAVLLTDLSVGHSSRTWYVDGEDYGNQPSFILDYPISRDSSVVKLIISSDLGCLDSAYKVLYLDSRQLFVPNIIMPNSDNNNLFKVMGTNILEGEIWIFDRYGSQVWHTDNINDSWDASSYYGHVKGSTYVYTIRYRFVTEPNNWLRQTGTVTVVW